MNNDATPRARAVTLARELVATTRYTERSACEAALRAVPELAWSPDQLKAIAFGAVLYGFGRPA
jgi:hypothetical protein